MAGDTSVDYAKIEPAPGKDPENYKYQERRAEILGLIFEAGGPSRINKRELARYYDVHHETIYKDIDTLADYTEERTGTDVIMRTQAIFEKVVSGLLDDGKYRQAWITVKEWNQWLYERGMVDKEAEPIKHDVTHREESTESEDYEVITPGDLVEMDDEDRERVMKDVDSE